MKPLIAIKDYLFERYVLFSVAKKIGEAKVIVDIGAATGRYAKFFAKKFPNAQIYCFEPNPTQLIKLEKELGHFGGRVHIYPVALSDRAGTQVFYETPSADSSSLIPHEGVHTFPVETRTLDSFELATIDFMKVDAEGSELEIFQGGTNTLKSTKNLLVEINPSFKGFNGDDIKTFQILRESGLYLKTAIGDLFFSRSKS